MEDHPPITGKPGTTERLIRLPGFAGMLTPVLLVVGLSSIPGFARLADDGLAAPVVSAASMIWLSDAPFQPPGLDAAEDVAEHAAAPQAEQTEDVLIPVRVAVRRTRIGGLYGP